MSDEPDQDLASPEGDHTGDYVVVARRYRPQTFGDLIGQEHVAEALEAAITTGRVGHAYLFTGARGVGKTSAARILAKALDCQKGPTTTPCNTCEICLGVSSGEDVDVLEIDGASNRGIDQIRQLRSNVNIRPSRARFKIYIIDEVHMLTREAFNALLKTLEEPPEHVKFIFCTTEPTKIPITVLSRCQRYDFAGIETDAIRGRLTQIAEAEGAKITDDAVSLLARRAAGSMRDGQSLLEQLLALSTSTIDADAVHRMLGTAESARLLELATCLAEAEPSAALGVLDRALADGVDESQLIDQLLGLFRDVMVSLAGCSSDAFQYATSDGEAEKVEQIGSRMGLETVLAALSVFQQTQADMRYSTAQRTLTELAIVRCCRLEGIEQIGTLLARLDAGEGSSGGEAKKKLAGQTAERSVPAAGAKNPPNSPPKRKTTSTPAAERSRGNGAAEPPATAEAPSTAQTEQSIELTDSTSEAIWQRARAHLTGIIQANAQQYCSLEVAGSNQLRIKFSEEYKICKSVCERPEHARKITEAVSAIVGTPVRVEFGIEQAASGEKPVVPRATQRQETRIAVAENKLMRRAQELFGARPTGIDRPQQ
ncbi:MAG: DNA polymerase III subunit gamma/tau [Pirellulales bacterium]|nr:DNA polymerase III subunit gamma/tau [Pirellulales bacterium]